MRNGFPRVNRSRLYLTAKYEFARDMVSELSTLRLKNPLIAQREKKLYLCANPAFYTLHSTLGNICSVLICANDYRFYLYFLFTFDKMRTILSFKVHFYLKFYCKL